MMRSTARHPGTPAGSPPWPLAVGVLLLPADVSAGDRAERRLSLALDAYRLGYYLLDLFEVAVNPAEGCPGSDGGACGWGPVEALAVRADVDALVVQSPGPAIPSGWLPVTLAGVPLRLLAA